MELKPGYKQTEVGVIPEEWEVAELRSVCSMKSGEGITSANIDQYSRFPCYGGNGLRGFTNRFTHDGSYALIGRQGALCGNVTSAHGKFFASEHAVVVTASQQTDIGWLTYVLGEMRLNRFSESSAQPGLSVSKVLKLRLAAPPTKAEQRAIAEALSDVDALLDGLDRLIAKKRNLKQAAMQQLLTGQTRLPGFHGEWKTKTLGSFVEIKKGELITEANAVPGAIPVVAGGKQPSYFHNRANRPGKTITISGSGASAGYVSFHTSPIFASDCSTISEGRGYCIEFVYFLLQSRQEEIYRAQTGGAQPHIHPSDLRPMIMRVPTPAEQSAIAEVLSEMDAELAALEQRREKTRALKQAMMQELLTGRTRLVKPEAVCV